MLWAPTMASSPWGDVSVFVDVGCATPSHRRALWIGSTSGALPMPAKPKARASSFESVELIGFPSTPPAKEMVCGALPTALVVSCTLILGERMRYSVCGVRGRGVVPIVAPDLW